MADLSIVYYTANVIPEAFAETIRTKLLESADGLPIIIVAKKDLGYTTKNIVVDTPRSHISIYRDALVGVKAAKTKYVALCEDDVLYSPEHFKYRPSSGKFAYNVAYWNIYTWSDPPVFSWKGRRNLGQLICERDLFIEAMEERFAKHGNYTNIANWGEPGKYERNLGVTIRESETFWTNPPNIAFFHETALSFGNLGTRKKVGELRATEIPYWGKASETRELYR